MRKVKYFVLVMFAMLALNGCGGSDSSPATTSVSLSGTAVDGYISGATAFIDINGNGTWESPEPVAITDANGTFSFAGVEVAKDKLLTIIVTGGIDTATNKPFVGELKSIVESAAITAQTPLSVTPLTDLIATSFLQSTTKDTQALNNAKAEIAQVFNLSQEDVIADPMTNVAVFAKVQEVQQIKALLEVAVAKAATNEMAETQLSQLRNDITLSIVTQIKESGASTLDVSEVLTEIARVSSVTIPQNEITFIAAQITEIKKSLDALAADTTVDVANLDKFQAGLEKEQETALERLQASTPEEVIVVVPAGDTNALIESGGQVPGELTEEELAAAKAAEDAAAQAAADAAAAEQAAADAAAAQAAEEQAAADAAAAQAAADAAAAQAAADAAAAQAAADAAAAQAAADAAAAQAAADAAAAQAAADAAAAQAAADAAAAAAAVTPTLAASTGTIEENASAGTAVGNITISNAGGTPITAITLSGTGSADFEVSTSGAITVKAGALIDFETRPSYALTAVATNTGGASASVTVTITVINIVETVPSLAPFSASISEDASIGAVVGTITATAEGSSITAFTLSDATNFAVSAAGEITTVTTLDFETISSYALTVFATNTLGSSSPVNVTINIARVAESAPAADQNLAGQIDVPPAPPAL